MAGLVKLADVAPKAKVGATGVITLEHNQTVADALAVRSRRADDAAQGQVTRERTMGVRLAIATGQSANV
jgi:hypothetical protein